MAPGAPPPGHPLPHPTQSARAPYNVVTMKSTTIATELTNLLELASDDISLGMFLEYVWQENSALAKIFFVNKNQLFPSFKENEVEIILKYLFWDTYVSFPSLVPSVMGVEFISAKVGPKYSGKLESTMEALGADLREIVIYYLIRFIKASPELRELIDTDDFNYGKMKQVLKDYDSLSKLIKKMISEVQKVDSIEDDAIKHKLKQISNLKWLTVGFDEIINAAIKMPMSLQMLPLWGHVVKESLIEAQNLQREEYTGAINLAYLIGLFDSSHSLFWCENCRDSSQVYYTSSKLDPYHVEMQCLKCKETMYAAIAYRLKPTLLSMIEFKDGFLAVALGYLLNSENIKYQYSARGKYEYDFLCDLEGSNVLIECKMHRTDVGDRGIKETLQKDLNQLLKHVKELKEKDIEIVRSISITNYNSERMKEIAEKILSSKKYAKKVNEYGVKLISFEEAPVTIRNFKQLKQSS